MYSTLPQLLQIDFYSDCFSSSVCGVRMAVLIIKVLCAVHGLLKSSYLFLLHVHEYQVLVTLCYFYLLSPNSRYSASITDVVSSSSRTG